MKKGLGRGLDSLLKVYDEETEPKKKQHQLQVWLVMEVKSDAVKSNIA